MDAEHLVDLVRTKRIALGYSIRELAQAAGLHRRTIDALCSGAQDPETVQLRTLQRAADVLGLRLVLLDADGRRIRRPRKNKKTED